MGRASQQKLTLKMQLLQKILISVQHKCAMLYNS